MHIWKNIIFATNFLYSQNGFVCRYYLQWMNSNVFDYQLVIELYHIQGFSFQCLRLFVFQNAYVRRYYICNQFFYNHFVRWHFMLYVWMCRNSFGQYWQYSGSSGNIKLINGIENEFLGVLVDVTSLIMSIYPLNHKHGCHNIDIGRYIW